MANVNLGQMEIDHVAAIGNSDIINLVAVIDMGLMQFSRTQSATTNDLHPEDVRIARGWIELFEQRFEHFAAIPNLFLPKAHPMPKKLPAPPVVNIIQNTALQNLMYSMAHMRTELLNCEDAEKLNGFHPQQAEAAIRPWIAKFVAFVEMMEENLTNPMRSWFPDADLQEPPVNAGEPR